MATKVKGTDTCNLPEWVPVPTSDSTTTIIDLVVAGSNVPFGIFAFLSNLAITVTALKRPSLQRPSNILLCSLAISDCLVGLVAQRLFFTWWTHIQRAQDYYSCLYLQLLTLATWITGVFPAGLSLTNLTVISLDRCYALCRPLAYRARTTLEENNRDSNHQHSYLAPRLRGIKQKEIAGDSGMKKLFLLYFSFHSRSQV